MQMHSNAEEYSLDYLLEILKLQLNLMADG